MQTCKHLTHINDFNAYLNRNQAHYGNAGSGEVSAPDIDEHEDQGTCKKWEVEKGNQACCLPDPASG